MGLAIVEPVVPVADLGLVEGARRHLGVLALLLPLRLLVPAGEVRPDPADEGEPAAVREPLRGRGSGRDLRQAAGLAPAHGQQVDLAVLVALALGLEGDPLPVGAPGRARLASLVRGQGARLAPVGPHEPQVGEGLLLLHVPGRHGHHRPLPVRRDRGRGQPLELPQQVRGQGRLRGLVRGPGRGKKENAAQESGEGRASHGWPPCRKRTPSSGGTRAPVKPGAGRPP